MYCKYCGKQVDDNAVICVGCGRLTDAGEKWQANQQGQQSQKITQPVQSQPSPQQSTSNSSGLATTAKVFMIISCVVTPLYIMSILTSLMYELDLGPGACLVLGLVSLGWLLPLTIITCRRLKNNQPISTGLKVCVLIFVNNLSGILLLCMRNNQQVVVPVNNYNVNTNMYHSPFVNVPPVVQQPTQVVEPTPVENVEDNNSQQQ